jgi:hypothetical protein
MTNEMLPIHDQYLQAINDICAAKGVCSLEDLDKVFLPPFNNKPYDLRPDHFGDDNVPLRVNQLNKMGLVDFGYRGDDTIVWILNPVDIIRRKFNQ